MDPNPLQPPTPTDAPLKSEVDDFLRRKRKVREHKACYPCRSRKVKCDLGRPCQTCREREHPELCDYHPPAKRHNAGEATTSMPPIDSNMARVDAGDTVTLSQTEFQLLCRKLESVEANLDDLRRELRGSGSAYRGESGLSAPPTPSDRFSGDGAPRTDLPIVSAALPPFHTRHDLTGQTVHLGGASVPALVVALGQGHREQAGIQEILGKSILPLFGLDNETATYPFIDLWGLAHGWIAKAEQLAKTIPTDNQCLTFFQHYRDMGHVIYPGLADIAVFERELTSFLTARSRYADTDTKLKDGPPPGVTEQTLYDRDLNWIGLLFAVLSSGCQSSNLPRKERELTSQVYMCCSLESLRFTNFLSVPTIESVQALLVLGNVISNNMNAGTSWNLIGLTARLAQSLGLHQPCPTDVSPYIKAHRSKVWWTLMWQDSLLSITYDRASFTALVDHSDMANPATHVGIPPFHSAMLRICKVGLDVVRDRTKPVSSREQFTRMSKGRDEIAAVLRETADHLRDLNKCRTLRDSVEYWALYLHVSYVTSELCRSAIAPTGVDFETSKVFRQTCLDSLINTVDAWLGLQNVTTYARHSWASIHRALSSALLLSIMGEHERNEHCRKLLTRFIGLMDNMTSSVEPQELAAPVTRAITALRKLKIHQRLSSGSSPQNGRLLPLPHPDQRMQQHHPQHLQNPQQQRPNEHSPQHQSHQGQQQEQHRHQENVQQYQQPQQQHQHLPPPHQQAQQQQHLNVAGMHQVNSPTHHNSQQQQQHPPRFIEDIALTGRSSRADTSSPSVRHSDPSSVNTPATWYSSGTARTNPEDQSPYTVRDSILWGNMQQNGAGGWVG